jgi:carbonic anhydrase
MTTGRDALERLREGNRRFVATGQGGADVLSPAARTELAKGQAPFAVVLGCADSRVPPEIIFDQGLGDLFVVRVAGDIAASSQIGSLEFAVQEFGTPLVVVLGHTRCGAVTATAESVRGSGGEPSPGLRAIVDRVRPAVEGVLAARRVSDARASTPMISI